MGYCCFLIQIRERVLRDVDEGAINDLFLRAHLLKCRGTSQRMLWIYEQPAVPHEVPLAVSLEKMSLALHRLLTGEFHLVDSPLSRAILGGTEFHSDFGDGPGRYLWADEVRDISAALAVVTDKDLRDRYDPVGLKAGWPMTPVRSDEDDEAVFGELSSYFGLLVTIYRNTVACGNAMLIGVV